MIRPDHRDNLIIGFLGELPLHTERFSLIQNRFQGPVDRDPSTPGNRTWSLVPSALASTLLPEAERFRFSSMVAFPEEAVFSPSRECLKSGANHSNLLTLTKNMCSSHLSITSIPLPPNQRLGKSLLQVKR